jgi:hypothetical protein
MFKLRINDTVISIDVKKGHQVGDLSILRPSAITNLIKKERGYHGRIIGNRCSPIDIVFALDLMGYPYKILAGEDLLSDEDPVPPGATP